jgi:hypothetical protein
MTGWPSPHHQVQVRVRLAQRHHRLQQVGMALGLAQHRHAADHDVLFAEAEFGAHGADFLRRCQGSSLRISLQRGGTAMGGTMPMCSAGMPRSASSCLTKLLTVSTRCGSRYRSAVN